MSTAWTWASCAKRGSRRRRLPISSRGPPSRATAPSCGGGSRDGSKAPALASSPGSSRPAAGRARATCCSAAPSRRRSNSCAISGTWSSRSERPSRNCHDRTITRREEKLMPKKLVVRTDKAPAPLQGAPYSQAIKVDSLVFVSGQIALKPGETALTGATAGEQTEQIFANLRAILEAAGSGLDRLVKTTVFLARMEDFAEMNEVYKRHAGSEPPARSTVQAAKLPAGALVEIEAVAHL